MRCKIIIISLVCIFMLNGCKKEEDKNNIEEITSLTVTSTVTSKVGLDNIIAEESECIEYNTPYFKNLLLSLGDYFNLKDYYPNTDVEDIEEYLAVIYSKSFCENLMKYPKINKIEIMQIKDTLIECTVYTNEFNYYIKFNVNELGLRSVSLLQ